jgi:hypothetical protein
MLKNFTNKKFLDLPDIEFHWPVHSTNRALPNSAERYLGSMPSHLAPLVLRESQIQCAAILVQIGPGLANNDSTNRPRLHNYE